MTKKNIDEIRGDLHTFKKLVTAVDFAVGAIDDHAALQKSMNELKSLQDSARSTLSGLNSEISSARSMLKTVKDKAEQCAVDSAAEAQRIIDEAKIKAEKILLAAETRKDSLEAEISIMTEEKTALARDVRDLAGEKKKAESELADATTSLESALARVKK